MKHFLLTFLVGFSLLHSGVAQSKKDVKRFKILSVTEVVTKYENGNPQPAYTHKVFKYTKKGELALEQEFEPDGTLQYEISRKFENGNEVEEIENFPVGRKKKDPYYEKKQRDFNAGGDELEEREFNKEGELVRREVYTYDAMGNKSEKLTYKNGQPDEKTVYVVDKKGLRTEEKQYSMDGELKKTVAYSYEFW